MFLPPNCGCPAPGPSVSLFSSADPSHATQGSFSSRPYTASPWNIYGARSYQTVSEQLSFSGSSMQRRKSCLVCSGNQDKLGPSQRQRERKTLQVFLCCCITCSGIVGVQTKCRAVTKTCPHDDGFRKWLGSTLRNLPYQSGRQTPRVSPESVRPSVRRHPVHT